MYTKYPILSGICVQRIAWSVPWYFCLPLSTFSFLPPAFGFRPYALVFRLSALGLQLSPSPVYVLQPYCNTINYVLQILLAAIDGACFI
jgi:hypothetical protein